MPAVPKPEKKKKQPRKESSPRKLQIKRMDNKFAVLTKLRANLTCQKTGNYYPLLDSGKIQPGLECSHFITRKRFNTRWSYENCYCINTGSHFFFDQHKQEYEKWLIEARGFNQDKIDLLKYKSVQQFSGDLGFIEIWIDQELEKVLPNFQKLNYSFLKPIYDKIEGV